MIKLFISFIFICLLISSNCASSNSTKTTNSSKSGSGSASGSGSGSSSSAASKNTYDPTVYPMGPPGPGYQITSPDFTPLITNISWNYNPNPNAKGFNVLLSRPTDSSITVDLISLVPVSVNVTIDYWPSPIKIFGLSTKFQTLTQYKPTLFEITGLSPNTNYTYQIHYNLNGIETYVPSNCFRTARPAGETFSFAIEADPHHDLAENYTVLNGTYTNLEMERPDFLISLGDFTMNDKLPAVNYSAMENRAIVVRQWYDFLRDIPLFYTLGNHEYETLSNVYNISNMSLALRKMYFPNPVANSFFTGNVDAQNYYSFNWGNALFVMLDPFRFTASFNNWTYSLGYTQYKWMRTTLENSNATYKFVFSHNLVGGGPSARGGIEFANLYEWGGYHSNGTYGFDTMRPGWGKPIHQVLVDTKVRAWFHGHDHLYVRQSLDGVVYQECPQPGHINLGPSSTITANSYGYYNGTIFGYSGHLLVKVSPTNATVQYLMWQGAVVEDSYTFYA